MPPTIHQILNPPTPDPSKVQRIAHRVQKLPLAIVHPDPSWPQTFATLKILILSALGPETALSVEHTGSLSVPGLPAKTVIDVDLVVPDPSSEKDYVPKLEAAGFRFLLREPEWMEHRFFVWEPPPSTTPATLATHATPANLHVFGPNAAEPVRHRIFRHWLRENEGDRERYADVKREAMREAEREGEGMEEYTARKDEVIHDMLQKAFRSLGYVE
jgi:GrpB-like predicted nucleotidyltransferase (UPF0157 family)